MRILILNFLICFCLSSCELIQQEENQPDQAVQKVELPTSPNKILIKNHTPSQTTIKPTTKIIQVGQNPDKSFHDTAANVTQGNPRHSFPSENLLK